VDVLAEPELLTSAIDSLLAWGTGLGQDLHVKLVREAGSARGEIWLRVMQLHRQAQEGPLHQFGGLACVVAAGAAQGRQGQAQGGTWARPRCGAV
jgi:hypothetical protein